MFRFRFGSSFWPMVCNYMFYVFGFISRYFFRFDGDENSREIDSDCRVVQSQEDVWNCFEELEPDGFGKKEKSEVGLRVQPSTGEDFYGSNGETECSVFTETASTSSTSKYQFMSGKHVSGFIEEPTAMSFTFQKFYVGSDDDSISNSTILDSSCSTNKDFNLEAVAINQQKTEDSAERLGSGEVLEEQEQEQVTCTGHGPSVIYEEGEGNGLVNNFLGKHDSSGLSVISEKGEREDLENNFLGKHESSDEVRFLSENSFFSLESEPGSINDVKVSITHKVDSIEEILSQRIGKGSERETCVATDDKKAESREEIELEHETFVATDDKKAELREDIGLEPETCISTDEKKAELREEIPCLAEIHSSGSSVSDPEAVSEDDYIELEPHSGVFNEQNSSGKDFGKAEDKHEPKDLVHREETEPMDNLEKSEEPRLQEKSSNSDSDDEFEFEFLKEHQDLIQQLKMEIKNVKARGLPTILEESESPKVVEDLKPLKIDRKLEHKDRMEEIQNFYKSYAEKMRKLDILNNQSMHALGLLRLKDPVQLNSTRKTSAPAIKSILSWNLRTSKVGNHEADPAQKFIRELYRDLEMVYVGQVCLSWEILYWQYGKAQELQDYDSHGSRQYNRVAGEYQQFQVLLRRFIENGPFQGPRIQNYVENRCILRNHFLQVPAIRDDYLKDKKSIDAEGEYVISIAMLTEIIEESMRIFWEFLRADKDEANVITKGTQVDLEDPAALELLMEVQTNLQKKERKLKELLRSRNCIVKKFQKHQEYSLHRALLFVQVEVKLVSRVLSMSRLTADQLVWCHKKLKQIDFVSNRIHMEPSFSLFPC